MQKIITKRPDGMSYAEYREARKNNQESIRNRVKHGVLVYIAVEQYKDEVGNDMRHTYMPAVKTYDKHGKVVYASMKKKEFK